MLILIIQIFIIFQVSRLKKVLDGFGIKLLILLPKCF
nr:MAG TPA: hypothetical protein [Bacteriophage sp.]